MTQIIWSMLSHVARFSVFIVGVITSIALTFKVLLGGCTGGNRAYATMADTHLTPLRAMLGSFYYEDVTGSNDCMYPHMTDKAATVLLLFYLVIATILLMNLLIAVLSTPHAEVRSFQSQAVKRGNPDSGNRYMFNGKPHRCIRKAGNCSMIREYGLFST